MILFGGGGAIPACIAGCIPAYLAAGLGGGGWYPSMPCRFPGPQPRGKLRGIWSRPTAKGEVEGDLVQAHTQGGVEGDLARGSALGGVCSGRGVETPHDGHCCGRYALYWNAFLFLGTFLMTIF